MGDVVEVFLNAIDAHTGAAVGSGDIEAVGDRDGDIAPALRRGVAVTTDAGTCVLRGPPGDDEVL